MFFQGNNDSVDEYLKEFKQLETLNASYELPYKNRAPFSGEILQLINLKSLNLSGNLNAESFVEQLKTLIEFFKIGIFRQFPKTQTGPMSLNIVICSLIIFQSFLL